MSPKTAAILVTVLVAIHSCDRFILQPRKDEETRLFQSMTSSDVTHIEMKGANNNSFDLVKATLIIRDTGQIQSICQAMREARRFDAGHPVSEWNCELHFVTAARTWRTRISSTSNGNGVTIQADGGNELRNDSLGPMLEKIAKDHAQARPPLPRP